MFWKALPLLLLVFIQQAVELVLEDEKIRRSAPAPGHWSWLRLHRLNDGGGNRDVSLGCLGYQGGCRHGGRRRWGRGRGVDGTDVLFGVRPSFAVGGGPPCPKLGQRWEFFLIGVPLQSGRRRSDAAARDDHGRHCSFEGEELPLGSLWEDGGAAGALRLVEAREALAEGVRGRRCGVRPGAGRGIDRGLGLESKGLKRLENVPVHIRQRRGGRARFAVIVVSFAPVRGLGGPSTLGAQFSLGLRGWNIAQN